MYAYTQLTCDMSSIRSNMFSFKIRGQLFTIHRDYFNIQHVSIGISLQSISESTHVENMENRLKVYPSFYTNFFHCLTFRRFYLSCYISTYNFLVDYFQKVNKLDFIDKSIYVITIFFFKDIKMNKNRKKLKSSLQVIEIRFA